MRTAIRRAVRWIIKSPRQLRYPVAPSRSRLGNALNLLSRACKQAVLWIAALPSRLYHERCPNKTESAAHLVDHIHLTGITSRRHLCERHLKFERDRSVPLLRTRGATERRRFGNLRLAAIKAERS